MYDIREIIIIVTYSTELIMLSRHYLWVCVTVSTISIHKSYLDSTPPPGYYVQMMIAVYILSKLYKVF